MRLHFIYIILVVTINLSGVDLIAQILPDSLLNAAKNAGDDSSKAYLYNDIALFYTNKENPDSALHYAELSLKLAESLKDTSAISEAKYLIGNAYYSYGSNNKAIKYFQESLDLARKTNDSSQIGRVLNNIGILFWDTEQYQDAVTMFKESGKYDYLSNDPENYIITYLNLGSVYSDMGNDSALFYLNAALKLANEENSESFLTIIYNNLGDHFKEKGNYRQAEKYFLNALTYLISDESPDTEAYITFNLAEVCMKTNRKAQAAYYLARGYRKIDDNSNKILFENYLELKYKLDSINKDYYSALHTYQELNLLQDSLNNTEYLTKLANFQTIFELDKKNSEILLLQQKNKLNDFQIRNQRLLIFLFIAVISLLSAIIAIILVNSRNRKKVNLRLQSINKELKLLTNNLTDRNKELRESDLSKSKFISIVAHDLKNPLNSIHGLSELLSLDYGLLSENEKINYVKMINTSSKQITELIEDLLEWSRSQNHDIKYRPEEINIHEILEDSINYLAPIAKQKDIKIINYIPADCYGYADLHMIFTIFRNLLSNAIKFSEPGKKVEVSVEKNSHLVTVFVKDYGIGMTDNMAKSLFLSNGHQTKPGTHNESGTGIGLTICKEFIILNKGEIGVESELHKGSTFWIKFPSYSN